MKRKIDLDPILSSAIDENLPKRLKNNPSVKDQDLRNALKTSFGFYAPQNIDTEELVRLYVQFCSGCQAETSYLGTDAEPITAQITSEINYAETDEVVETLAQEHAAPPSAAGYRQPNPRMYRSITAPAAPESTRFSSHGRSDPSVRNGTARLNYQAAPKSASPTAKAGIGSPAPQSPSGTEQHVAAPSSPQEQLLADPRPERPEGAKEPRLILTACTLLAIVALARGGYTRARARARRHAQTKAYVYNIR